jgi:hypothetical protein
MSFDEFIQLRNNGVTPDDLSPLLKALLLDAAGEWNVYDSLEQLVDNKIVVKLQDGSAIKDKPDFYHRITWTDNMDGTVRQVWESLAENGKVIELLFDGLDVPQKK